MSGIDEKPDSIRDLEEGQRLHEGLREDYARVLQELETERENYITLQESMLEQAEDFAAPIIETTLNALMATRGMFDEYYRPSKFQRLKRWIKNVWKR